ncbi:DUF4062 domain-containing protein [Cohaesibacter sp. CAU 1516]|uniref:DUF4062 domain-containing protein n=1 Tax=Cohaesibacter sp. CAU 1516 TaxID=2576038 RepID=UPI0010FF1E0A|nr:DUF4062 domain-containing protein [Cohaesibacter sp. CAU 1516]TLP48142.1 DUF4062 domain-containing protein [Cohaesibacter sp. CAU 1516]
MASHEKRYQVFISSTFEDLREERRAVQDVVISTGDFPVQMESFPAADLDQFTFIKSLIDLCDYYVLIIAGRYGTIAEDGMSYTEKEYRYAVSKGVPVLVMVHSDRGSIAVDKSEKTEKGKADLDRFIHEASDGRLRKSWNTIDGLKLAVREALDYSKATQPRVGWVRGDQISSRETLEELNEVRKENAKFRDALGELEIDLPLPDLPAHDDELDIDLIPNMSNSGYGGYAGYGSHVTIRCSWIAVFPHFFTNLEWKQSDWDGHYSYYVDDDDSSVKIGSALAAETSNKDTTKSFKISHNTLEKLTSYYIELGFMRQLGAEEPFTDLAKRFARRQMVTNNPSAGFKVIRGDVEVTKKEQEDLDDEIPF